MNGENDARATERKIEDIQISVENAISRHIRFVSERERERERERLKYERTIWVIVVIFSFSFGIRLQVH